MHRSNKPFYSIVSSARASSNGGMVSPEGVGGLEVDYQVELDRGLDWQLIRFLALENAIDIRRSAPEIIDQVISIGQQAADCSELTVRTDGRKAVPRRQPRLSLMRASLGLPKTARATAS